MSGLVTATHNYLYANLMGYSDFPKKQ